MSKSSGLCGLVNLKKFVIVDTPGLYEYLIFSMDDYYF
jgi:hypothetical protein